MKNYYEILEVYPKASKEIIQKVYKLKIKQTHPDLFPNEDKPKAEEMIKHINEAYEVLSNDEKRADYDTEFFYMYGTTNQDLIYENEMLKKQLYEKDIILNDIEINDKNYAVNLNEEDVYHKSKYDQYVDNLSGNLSKDDVKRYYLSIFIKAISKILLLVIMVAVAWITLKILTR